MSTELGDFAGIGEHAGAPFAAQSVSATRFLGRGGQCVQLTISADKLPPLGIQYVQLTRAQWVELRDAVDVALGAVPALTRARMGFGHPVDPAKHQREMGGGS